MGNNDLIAKWQHVLDRVNIPTWTETLTLAYLAELASKSENIIEAGTYLGASAKVMLLANPDLRLVCIDTFECHGEPMMLDYLNLLHFRSKTGVPKDLTTLDICRFYSLKQEIEVGRCKLVQGNSEHFSRWAKEQPFADAIFVDGGHQEWQVWDDCHYLLPFLKVGGELCGHDYDQMPPNDVYIGVNTAFQKSDIRLPVPRLWSVTKREGLTLGDRPSQ